MTNSQGKHQFISAIEKAHGRQLLRFLSVRMRASPEDVKDLMQEIYLRLLRLKDHDAVRNPQAYLYTIASHVLHQHVLRRNSMPTTMDPLEVVEALEQISTAADPAEEADLERQLEAIGRGLQARSPRAYATLIMYRCEGMTFKQIGDRLGVSSVMARKYLIMAIDYVDRHLIRDSEIDR